MKTPEAFLRKHDRKKPIMILVKKKTKQKTKATSTKTKFDRASFLTETENLRIRKITSQQISKKK